MPSHRSNPLAHGYKTKHVVWHRSEGSGGKGSADDIARYVLGQGLEYSMVIDTAGDIVQLYPITTGARSLENGGVDGGVGCNRDAAICFQICLTGYTKDSGDIKKLLKNKKFVELIQWLDAWGIPRVDASSSSRSMDKWRTSGHTTHSSAPHNSHTDSVPLGWLKTLGKASSSSAKGKKKAAAKKAPAKPAERPQRYVVQARKHGEKDWHPVQVKRFKGDKANRYSLATGTDHLDHIRPEKAVAKEMLAWARKQGYEARVCKVATYEKSASGGGDVRLSSGAIWPDDPLLLSKLHSLSKKLGRPIQVVSGLRRTGSPGDLARNVQPRTQWYFYELMKSGRGALAAVPGTSQHEQRGPGRGASDTDVVTASGQLVSLGNYPGGYKAARDLGLHFTAQGEPWHISCSGPDRWSP
jgi:hypothetical protein